MEKIFSFSNEMFVSDDKYIEKIGVRGQNIIELAKLGIPILPGFILTEDFLGDDKLNSESHQSIYFDAFGKMGKILGKKWDSDNPLLVKLVVSPTLNMVRTFSSIHNIGLCDTTVEGFSSFVGEKFAYQEYRGVLLRIMKLDELTMVGKNQRRTLLKDVIAELQKAKTTNKFKALLPKIKALYPEEIFSSALEQFCFVKDLFCKFFAKSETLNDSAILVQAMTFGNYGKESLSGAYFTRDPIAGNDALTGEFFQNSFDDTKSEGWPIGDIKRNYLSQLKKIAKELETYYREIRKIKFTVENGNLWVIDQSDSPEKSAQAEIRTLLALLKANVVDEEYVVTAIQPNRLSEILHPVIDRRSASTIPSFSGGIAGAMGAAVGKVYFSTEALMTASRASHREGSDPSDFILAMPSTYAEDVKAIEAGRGVLTSDGGYASHAPVVARSLGKVAMINPDLRFTKSGLKIGNKIVKEGDYLSLHVSSHGTPVVYFGKLDLVDPVVEKSGLLEFLEIVQRHVKEFDVHVNADHPREAKLAKLFLADGIGLCRTEHMFFHEKHIPLFRTLIIASTYIERKKILSKLKRVQMTDFYGLFEVMGTKPVTIRLLDAPLHEFLPHSKESMDSFITYYRKEYPNVSSEEIKMRCDILSEVNPMLGHRGVRVAVSYPEIYRMQVEAIFEAAFKLRKEKGIVCKPEIMIPIVMNSRELKAVRFGKKIEGFEIVGVRQVEEEIRAKLGVKKIDYQVGTMIEIPAASLQADKIARYADFFSFGTNDLTQTCLGLSRDDFTSFFTDYNEYDLLDKNPFQHLQEPVKELISIATKRGRSVRPGLSCGLCGEHGAEPENIPFCMDIGLTYVSCSPYGIPLAKLAIAQENIKRKNKEQISLNSKK